MKFDRIHVGTSGWNYWHWRGLFYPEELERRQWLAFYMQQFPTLELNSSFYRHHTAATYRRWAEASPREFLWSVKAHREITHSKRLGDVREALARFFACVDALGDRLGVILFQLPPSLRFDPAVAGRFFAQLPAGYRYALEPRHASWLEPAPLELLRQHRVALCVADSGRRYPMGEAMTADFVYVRLHGPREMYASEYTPAELGAWAAKLRGWRRPGFVYFDNDFHGYAIQNALALGPMVEAARCGRVKSAKRAVA